VALAIVMSALGHKQTYAAQQAMSALHPIATAKADSRKRSCPLYPRKRTCAVHAAMSALGHKRTCANIAISFKQHVGALQKRFWNCEANCLGRSEINDKLEFGGLLYG
jgi:hypothetical protein